MANEPAEKPSDLDGLVERLLATAERFVNRKGHHACETYHLNPDGPEAAAAIRSLQAWCAELEARITGGTALQGRNEQ